MIYVAGLLITLILALMDISPMFATRAVERWSMFGITTPWLDTRVLLLLGPFIILNFPTIKASFVAFLNAGEDEAR